MKNRINKLKKNSILSADNLHLPSEDFNNASSKPTTPMGKVQQIDEGSAENSVKTVVRRRAPPRKIPALNVTPSTSLMEKSEIKEKDFKKDPLYLL